MGWCGVDLFFVLSGFLISGLLFQEYKRFGDIHLKTFWLRRGFKIYPAFYVYTLIQTFVYVSMFGHKPGLKPPSHLFLVDATFLCSYFPGISGHVWSLAVEEHFYVLLPLLLLLLLRIGAKKQNPFASIPAIFAAMAIACLSLRMLARPSSINDYYSYLLPTHLRMDALFCGVTVGYLFHFHPQFLVKMARWPLAVAGAMLLTPAYFMEVEYWHMYTWGLTCMFLGFACILIWAIHLPYRREHFLAWPVNQLARVGFYSYSIYLWHWMILFYLRPYLLLKGWAPHTTAGSAVDSVQWIFWMAFCVAAGITMARVVEQPALNLRDRWFPSRTRPISVAENSGAGLPVAVTPAMAAAAQSGR